MGRSAAKERGRRKEEEGENLSGKGAGIENGKLPYLSVAPPTNHNCSCIRGIYLTVPSSLFSSQAGSMRRICRSEHPRREEEDRKVSFPFIYWKA